MPENRFKQLREEEAGRRRDKDPKCELFTQDKLSKELFDKCHYYISSSKIKKLETNTEGVKIDAALLLAYKNFFHVSIDWLIDSNVKTQFLSGDIAITSKTTGLSDDAINTLSRLKNDPSTKYLLQILNVLMEDKDSFTALLANMDFFMNPHTYSPGVATNNPVHGKRVVNSLHAGDCNAFIKLNSSKECIGTYEIDQNFMASACMIKIFEILLDYKFPTKKEQV